MKENIVASERITFWCFLLSFAVCLGCGCSPHEDRSPSQIQVASSTSQKNAEPAAPLIKLRKPSANQEFVASKTAEITIQGTVEGGGLRWIPNSASIQVLESKNQLIELGSFGVRLQPDEDNRSDFSARLKVPSKSGQYILRVTVFGQNGLKLEAGKQQKGGQSVLKESTDLKFTVRGS